MLIRGVVSDTNGSRSSAVNERKIELTSFEKKIMLAMGLKNVQQLDELLAEPISQWAADHSESPDEVYEMYDRALERLELEKIMRERFESLSKTRYVS
jgi:hypothetical protein